MLARRASVVAVADPSPEARERAHRIAGVGGSPDPADVLARPDVDAVVICAPSAAPAELAVAAASAGKHVYLEKPLAVDAEGGERAVEVAARAGVTASIGFNRRFHPVFEQARAALRAGAVGEVRVVSTAFCEPTTPTSMPGWKRARATGGGVLLDLASHHFDLVPWLLDRAIVEVEARTASALTEQDEAWVRAVLHDGVEAHGFFSFRAARTDVVELHGDRGTLRADRYAGGVQITVARGRHGVRTRRLGPTPALVALRLRRGVRPADEPSYRRALRRWLDELRGAPRSVPTFEDGLRSLRVVLAAESAAETVRATQCAS